MFRILPDQVDDVRPRYLDSHQMVMLLVPGGGAQFFDHSLRGNDPVPHLHHEEGALLHVVQ